jgi:hypothetical protein
MIWTWSTPDKYPNKRMGNYVRNSGTDRFVFREGKVITKEIIAPKIVFECSEKYLYDVLPNSGQLIVVLKKVVEIMEELCKHDIQVFNANVYVGKKKIPNYFLIRIVIEFQHAVQFLLTIYGVWFSFFSFSDERIEDFLYFYV